MNELLETFSGLKELLIDCVEELNDIIEQQDIDIDDICGICLLCNEEDTVDDMLSALQTVMEEELNLPVDIIDPTVIDSDFHIEPGCLIPTIYIGNEETLYY